MSYCRDRISSDLVRFHNLVLCLKKYGELTVLQNVDHLLVKQVCTVCDLILPLGMQDTSKKPDADNVAGWSPVTEEVQHGRRHTEGASRIDHGES